MSNTVSKTVRVRILPDDSVEIPEYELMRLKNDLWMVIDKLNHILYGVNDTGDETSKPISIYEGHILTSKLQYWLDELRTYREDHQLFDIKQFAGSKVVWHRESSKKWIKLTPEQMSETVIERTPEEIKEAVDALEQITKTLDV